MQAAMFSLESEERRLTKELEAFMQSMGQWEVEDEAARLAAQAEATCDAPAEDVGPDVEERETSLEELQLREHFMERLFRLDAKHLHTMSTIREHYEKVCAQWGLNSDEWTSSTGGWQAKANDRFKQIFKDYYADGQGRQFCLDRLRLEMPKTPLKSIEAHYEWYVQRWFMKKKVKGEHEAHAKAHATLISQAKKEIEELRHAEEQHCLHLAELEVFEAKRAKLRVVLDALHTQAQQKRSLEEQARYEEQQREEALRREEEAQLKAEMEKKKALLAQYRLQKSEEQRLRDEEEQRWQMELQEENRKRGVYNKQRVDYRQQEFDMKVEEQKLREMEMEEAAQQREERLEQMRLQVRKYGEADEERLKGHTEASKQNKDLAKAVVLFRNDGYNVKQLMSDYRFKLATALSDAGLSGGKYAHSTMRALPAHVPAHMASTAMKQDAA